MKKKTALLVLSMMLYGGILAQETTILKISGTSEITVMPDEAMIYLNIEGMGATAEKANEEAQNKLLRVQNVITDLGYKKELLKVNSSNVQSIRKYNEKKPTGYRAIFNTRVKLSASGSEVTRLIEALAANGNDVGSSVQYQISKELAKSQKEDLIKRAIDQAKERAVLIADHMGLRISGVSSIQYSEAPNGPVNFARMEMSMSVDEGGVDFSLQERTLRESINIEFELSKI